MWCTLKIRSCLQVVWYQNPNGRFDFEAFRRTDESVKLHTPLEYCISFYTLPQDSGRALCFHIGCLWSIHGFVLFIHFSFLDYNPSKYQWIFTKLGMCVYIVILWSSGSGLLIGQILSIFDAVICLPQVGIFLTRGKFCQFFGSFLPTTHPYFLFMDDNE